VSGARLPTFVEALDGLITRSDHEAEILARAGALLKDLVSRDDWLPDAFAAPNPEHYRQYLLHADARARFSVVSFVWGPGQATPIHDHTVWGLVGMLRGAELSQAYSASGGRLRPQGPVRRLLPGEVEAVSPTVGDIHRVANAFDDRVSISIHVYGADIGTVCRHTYDTTGRTKTFISGYSSPIVAQAGGASARTPA
jgi:predicted metal-dependent enzyme (double-stranded beta helix superfamily)